MSGACVYVGYETNGCRVWWEVLNEKDHLEDLGLYGRILKQILRDGVRVHELDLSGLGQDQVAGCCDYSNEL
jgi:hypothetical protein